MSTRQRLRKAKREEAKKEALRRWKEKKSLYRVSFPWKQVFLLLGSFMVVGLLIWLIPKGVVFMISSKIVSGSFGTISKEELQENKFATLVTNKGNIKFELFSDTAPKTVANFVLLSQKDFYDGIKFHRIIGDFMIQTGDPLSMDDDPNNNGTGGPGYQFEDEFNKDAPKLVKGVLAMANSGPDTNGSQFFIVTSEATPWLDGKHTSFGRVTEGIEVVEEIGQVKTDNLDYPLEDIIIEDVILSQS